LIILSANCHADQVYFHYCVTASCQYILYLLLVIYSTWRDRFRCNHVSQHKTHDVHVVHAISGYWAYGILAQLPAVLRTIFILACAAVLYLAFLVGDTFNALCHSLFDNKVARD
uniref:TLC domain-containing protein n=1 Tax=Toxocara canis TaxID=6265 RepID=A0A183TYN4_TOXCA